MLSRNLTPFLFGAKSCSRSPPRVEMTAIVRGSFLLRPGEPVAPVEGLMGQGFLTAELFGEDDEDRRGECLYPGDFADHKVSAEVMLAGACHAPGGRPVTECPVVFRVGAWSKSLRVVGQRVWVDSVLGSVPSDPVPFTTMPITWANAFGGPGYARNPAGKGYKTRELCTLERPRDVIRSPAAELEPAGFGPINPAWPQRAALRGKEYGRRYRAERAPWYPEDFDWRHFSAAPADQQLPGYLRGDEELAFQNLHPAAPIFTARLPGLRVRVFVVDVDGAFREIPMALDTLYADLHHERLVLTWRGLGPAREDDLSDVRAALIASEPLEGERLPEARYREALEAFARDPAGLKEALHPKLQELAERERGGGAAPAASGGDGPRDPVEDLLRDKLELLPPEQAAAAREALQSAMAREGGDKVRAAIIEAAAREGDTPPTPMLQKPGAAPPLGLRRIMRQVQEQAAALKAKLEGRPVPEEQRRRVEELERLPHDPRWRELDPDYTPPEGPVSAEEPGPGRDLRERDLTGQDLRGLDLRGADLREAILTRADLRGANLRGANLRCAILFKAQLGGADLTGADLSRVNAAQARAEGAILDEVKLDLACLEDATLAGASLRGARGEFALLARADLGDARLGGAALHRSDLSETTLDRAVLAGASLTGCALIRCRGVTVDLSGADLGGASLAGAALPGARLGDCRADGSVWAGADISGADLGFATLRRAIMPRLAAAGARFHGADLRGARLDRADLQRADLTRANLFEANLNKARLGGTRFTGASLYGATLVGASGAGADFTGANLKRSTLEGA